ncbi:MAG: AmmeMemoRadiSam system protein B [Caldisericaceae bacterium]
MKKQFIVIFITLIFVLSLVIFPLTLFAPKQNIEIYAGVVPHHLLASDIILNFFKNLRMDESDVIVLLSVDHFYQCNSKGVDFITTDLTNFKDFQVERGVIKGLANNFSLLENNAMLSLDHGIVDILPFLKLYFPHIKLVPVIISRSLTFEKAKQFTETLFTLSKAKTTVIASVDFSHDLPEEIAKLHDERSIRLFLNFEEEGFSNIDVDSPQALFIARYFAKLKGADSFTVIGKENSNNYLKEKQPQTTSYFSALIGKGLKEELTKKTTETFIFTGDIMLDRSVNKLMQAFGFDYPFEKITKTLSSIDYVVGNLEGPILYNKKPYIRNSLNFSFDKKTAVVLSSTHFNILSLANNHTDNSGAKGLTETREILKAHSITPIGDPLYFNDKFTYKENNTLFLAFNFTYFFDNTAIKTVQKVRETYKDAFIIVLVHWGEEYIPISSSYVRTIAHQIIDVGGDIIIGSHPHVVQEVELYHSEGRNKDSLIFYSLGNFIFDQYFSKETQMGLAVGLIKDKDYQEFILIPIDLTNSQPKLMEEKEKKLFLKELAKRSSIKIRSAIEKGVIKLPTFQG